MTDQMPASLTGQGAAVLSRHRPARYYDECMEHVHPEAFDGDEEAAAEYEDEFYERHFYAGDDEFWTCEDRFVGFACTECSDAADGAMIAWPCPPGDPALPLPEAQHG